MFTSPCRGRIACCSGYMCSRPILHRTVPSRPFSYTSQRSSYIGRAPLTIPSGVVLTAIHEAPTAAKRGISRKEPVQIVTVKGPRGEITMEIPTFVKIQQDGDPARKATLSVVESKDKRQREMWGTTRAYLQNHILGVSEGHTTIIRLVGVGYRASIESMATTVESEYDGQQFVSLKLGYSHPIELGIPLGIKASTPQPTRILLEGPEKQVVKQFAAEIRKWRVPEPYKGKGAFVDDETIKLKGKKVK